MYVLLLNEHFLLTPRGSSQCVFVSRWLPRSSRCRLAEPLSFSGCHAQVNPWSPTLKCIAGRLDRVIPQLAPSTTRVSRGRLTPRRIHLSLRPTVILTDWCNKNLTSLSQTAHHRPVLVGEGNGRERLGVGDTESVVCVSFRRGDAVKFRKKYNTFHSDAHSTPLATRLRPNSWGALNRNETCYA